ncbi:glycoside hydrolase family 15 protein [Cellulomonas denverensis]|uniref:Glycoside hydrolase family 15 protein n=1 Tax=Cellulomonas denverensis TaxID=264297 RepID=A0A7X6QZR9_9CELL|nr:glycoside hydrolase family 15 protein [Cellulomonas denverensis]NKY23425.1 glycoside hydrolase family 15 protein [Cellulomonas denverensis]GIG25094.1 glycosyl hydrolase [Cellulomonas denverensis]
MTDGLGHLDGDAGHAREGSGHAASEQLRPPAARVDGYAPLRSYAALGDGRTLALVAEDGRIDWLPLPDLDTPPVFAALVDAEDGGRIELAPTVAFRLRREYLVGTNVLVTTFVTDDGEVRVTEAMNTGVAGRLPWAELARRVEGVRGTVPMAWRVRPGTVFGTASPWVQDTVHGLVLHDDGVTVAVRTGGEMTVVPDGQQVSGVFTAVAGSRHLLVLAATAGEPVYLPDPQDADRGIDRTADNWRAWTREFHYDGPWGKAVQRSALTLKLLLHAPTGAIAAAGTTSLPESVAGGKNWDYRYAWVRDAAYTLDAWIGFGLREEVHAATAWVLHTLREHGLRVFFTLAGDLPEGQQEALAPGWRGIGPVLTGNRADGQLQLGIYGDLLAVMRGYVDAGNLLDAETGRFLAAVADQAADAWHRPDAGMWELPGPRHHTSSKLGCWQALRCAVHLAEQGQIAGDAARWAAESDRIADWVRAHCWSEERGAYLMAPGSDALDASILLHARSGFDTGERMSRTIDALRAELGTGPLLHRYTGMPEEEGSFVACAFWGVAAMALVGRREEARQWMDELLAQANDVGIWPEMIDARTGDFLGNLPQALSHLALVQAALTLAEE